jgi:hypothetical protein
VSGVSAALPPSPVLWFLNPAMRLVLRTPIGRGINAFGLLEFSGRRTGARYRIPVGLHHVDGAAYVVTPSRWRANFSEAATATLWHEGRARTVRGTLVRDPGEVADLVRHILAAGTPPRMIGLRLDGEHRLDADDVRRLDRAAIRLDDVRQS